MNRIVVVIPALNEVATLRGLCEACLRHSEQLIVVDDGSTDGTAASLQGLAVEVIQHPQRRGKGAALSTGFNAALALGADAVITLDGDGQHDPEDIPRLIAAHQAFPGSLVLAARLHDRKAAPWIRKFANGFADFWVSWAAGQRILDSQCGLRLYPRAAITEFRPTSDQGFVFESEVLIESSRRGIGVVALPIRSRYAANRRPSHFRPLMDVWHITRMVFRKIAGSALYLGGAWRALTRPARRFDTL
jgi:glycosyltransferase involved in cell wall biosynthesis